MIYERASTLDQIKEVNSVVTNILTDLTATSVEELGGGADDIDELIDVLYDETFSVLFGESGKVHTTALGYTEKLTNAVEEQLRSESLAFFITSVLPNFEMNWHHLEWAQVTKYYQYFAIIAARDHGKSYFYSNAYLAWKLYRYKPGLGPKHPLTFSKFCVLLSFSMDQMKLLLATLKDTIETNEILRARLKPTGSHGWGETRINCANGSWLLGKSFGSSIRGMHPGTLMIDDPLTDAVITSKTQRDKWIDYFHSVIMNAIVPGGQVGVVGTPFHEADLYANLKTKGRWHVREYPAIFPDGRLLWENRHDWRGLMNKREEQGELVFTRENLTKPIATGSSLFPYHILKKSIYRMDKFTLVKNISAFPMKFDTVLVSCDFAISAETGADFSVYIVWGIKGLEMYMIYMWRYKGASYGQQLKKLKQINSNFRPDIIAMEVNQMQVIFAQEGEDHGMPIVQHTTTGEKNDLRAGVPGMALMFERARFRFPYGDKYSKNVADLAISEFGAIAFTDKGIQGVGEHDDIPMSTYVGWNVARKNGMLFGFI